MFWVLGPYKAGELWLQETGGPTPRYVRQLGAQVLAGWSTSAILLARLRHLCGMAPPIGKVIVGLL